LLKALVGFQRETGYPYFRRKTCMDSPSPVSADDDAIPLPTPLMGADSDLFRAARLAYQWLYEVALPHVRAEGEARWPMTHSERNGLQAVLMALDLAIGKCQD
jgi:hypothetical protein